jgi:hypothetical protein
MIGYPIKRVREKRKEQDDENTTHRKIIHNFQKRTHTSLHKNWCSHTQPPTYRSSAIIQQAAALIDGQINNESLEGLRNVPMNTQKGAIRQ